MTKWQIGLSEVPFDNMTSGKKTIEVRLDRGKFALFSPGDSVQLRRDYVGVNGNVHDGELTDIFVRIVAIRKYADLLSMMNAEDYKKITPRANTVDEAVEECGRYYSKEEQSVNGVLAIEVVII